MLLTPTGHGSNMTLLSFNYLFMRNINRAIFNLRVNMNIDKLVDYIAENHSMMVVLASDYRLGKPNDMNSAYVLDAQDKLEVREYIQDYFDDFSDEWIESNLETFEFTVKNLSKDLIDFVEGRLITFAERQEEEIEYKSVTELYKSLIY